MAEKLLLDVRETCETLGISRTLLWKLTSRGDLPALKIGRAVRFRADDVRGFVAKLGEAA